MTKFTLPIAFSFLLSACSRDDEKISHALSEMREQVASDIRVDVDRSSLLLRYPSDRLYVLCGKATLERESDDPRMARHGMQRFIAHVHLGGPAITVFDGGRDNAARQEFQSQWELRCGN